MSHVNDGEATGRSRAAVWLVLVLAAVVLVFWLKPGSGSVAGRVVRLAGPPPADARLEPGAWEAEVTRAARARWRPFLAPADSTVLADAAVAVIGQPGPDSVAAARARWLGHAAADTPAEPVVARALIGKLGARPSLGRLAAAFGAGRLTLHDAQGAHPATDVDALPWGRYRVDLGPVRDGGATLELAGIDLGPPAELSRSVQLPAREPVVLGRVQPGVSVAADALPEGVELADTPGLVALKVTRPGRSAVKLRLTTPGFAPQPFQLNLQAQAWVVEGGVTLGTLSAPAVLPGELLAGGHVPKVTITKVVPESLLGDVRLGWRLARPEGSEVPVARGAVKLGEPEALKAALIEALKSPLERGPLPLDLTLRLEVDGNPAGRAATVQVGFATPPGVEYPVATAPDRPDAEGRWYGTAVRRIDGAAVSVWFNPKSGGWCFMDQTPTTVAAYYDRFLPVARPWLERVCRETGVPRTLPMAEPSDPGSDVEPVTPRTAERLAEMFALGPYLGAPSNAPGASASPLRGFPDSFRQQRTPVAVELQSLPGATTAGLAVRVGPVEAEAYRRWVNGSEAGPVWEFSADRTLERPVSKDFFLSGFWEEVHRPRFTRDPKNQAAVGLYSAGAGLGQIQEFRGDAFAHVSRAGEVEEIPPHARPIDTVFRLYLSIPLAGDRTAKTERGSR